MCWGGKVSKSLTIAEVKSRLPAHKVLKEETYVKVRVPCTFIDLEFGEWETTPDRVFQGGKHPKRPRNGLARRLSIEEIKSRLPENVTIVETSYQGTSKKCKFIDAEFGEWEACPRELFDGCGHPQRGLLKQIQKRTIPVDEIKERLPSHITLDETTYKNVNTKARFTDEVYGSWWAFPHVILRGGDHSVRGKIKGAKAHTTSIEEIKARLPAHITIDESTYVRQKIKCRFIDKEYGEWWAIPDGVLHGKDHTERAKEKAKQTTIERHGVEHAVQSPLIRAKIEETNLKRYGCKVSTQNLDVARKSARSQTRAIKKTHWKTNEEINCVASYEAAAVDYLNANQIDYSWQSQSFPLPDGRVYIPDCYLPIEDKWIEIKGYFRKDAKEKWDWFHLVYPNSELWDKTALRSKGIKIRW